MLSLPQASAKPSLSFRTLRRAGSWPVRWRFGAALGAGLLAFGLTPAALPLAGRASLALIWCVISTADAGHTRAIAARESPGRAVVFVFVPVAVACSLSAVGLLLSTGMMPSLPPSLRALHAGLAVTGVASAWLLLHTVFTLRYAHLYYDAGPEPGGLTFPLGSPHPAYFDFAYYAFVIGMTAQTADVNITSPVLRRATLLHGLLSFGFNTAVVAVSISGLVGVL
jgi:uncharacterized membrane protein